MCIRDSDKTVDYMKLDHEENPALGYRAIRICLTRRDFFKTQLRALLRDVYKRQGVLGQVVGADGEEVALGSQLVRDQHSGGGLDPVSYTHLDVYKRQITSNSDFVQASCSLQSELGRCF